MAPTTIRVMRKTPELIPPANPTPHELRFLSDVDDQDGLRFQMPLIAIYRNNPSLKGKDPVRIVRDAVAKALVFYYPFAGRLREYATRKLAVECTGEGVVFVEADADVALQQLGTLLPPIPNLQELLCDVPVMAGVINCPLMLIQVTRLTCGGFILALRYSHTMGDAMGILQFLTAVSELARGAEGLSVLPVWERHILSARYPPRVTMRHPEYDSVTESKGIPHDRKVVRHFFFGPTAISALRRSLPPHLQSYSRFQLVTACMWRSRTIATSMDPNEEVRLLTVVNIRKRLNPPLPEGYYGNAIVYPAAVTGAEELWKNPLHYAAELVKNAINEATDEYVKSVVDLMVVRRRPDLAGARTYLVSYAKGFHELDFGWGKPAYGGVARGGVDSFPRAVSYFLPFRNDKGEDGIMVPICLPSKAMEILASELQKVMVFPTSSIASAL